MKDRDLRRALLSTPPADEIGAQRRTWQLVRTAFDEREPTPWPRRHARPLIAAAAAVALLAAVLSPSGRAVISDVRQAIGTEEKVAGVPRAKPALFSLPTKGRVLVSAPTGSWIVSANGSKRRLGDYREASWSPRGLHVVVSNRNQLAAVTPKGDVRWSLARPRVQAARWSPSGFRVAYLSGVNLRVVAGDGTGDKRIGRAANVAPAWRPGDEHVLAYAGRRANVHVVNADSGQTLWRVGPRVGAPQHLEWSPDGSRLLIIGLVEAGDFALNVYDADGKPLQYWELDGSPSDASFAPDGESFALVRQFRGRGELLVVDAASLRKRESVFSGKGRFADVAWSPNGRWLLLGWESADQWLFIRSTDVEKIRANSNLSRQFNPGGSRAGPFPLIEGWCCAETQGQ